MAPPARDGNARRARASEPDEPPPRPRGRILPIAIAVALAGAGLVAFAFVPIAQSSSLAFTTHTPGSNTTTYRTNASFAHTGTYVFSWKASDTSATFTIREVGHAPFYSTFNATGSLNLGVTAGTAYEFGILDPHAATLSISGALHYAAPIL